MYIEVFYLKHFILLLLAILLIACTDPVGTNQTEDDVTVYTIKNGSILETGAPLPVTLVYDESASDFDYFKVSLYDDEGKELASNNISKSTIGNNRKKEIDLPENLQKGLYHIKFELVKGDTAVFSSVTDFFSGTGFYTVKTMLSYPPDPAPGENVLLIADSVFPAGSDPYFRWDINKKVVYEGLFSGGGNKYSWKTTANEGAFPVRVEMFPFAPSKAVFENFTSPFFNESTIFVSESNRKRFNEFSTESSFSTLFHFRGEIIDSGYNSLKGEPSQVKGSPEPDFRSGIYGYYFKNNDSIVIPSLSVPFSKHGEMQPFSIKFRFLPDYSIPFTEKQDAAPFFTAASDDRTFELVSGHSGRGEYYLELVSGAQRFLSRAVDLVSEPENIINLNISVYPEKNASRIVWMINGKTVKKDEVPFKPELGNTKGSTVIGGGLYPLLIDEAGVFTKTADGKTSVDPDAFKNFSMEKYGNDLILAEGFDSFLTEKDLFSIGNPEFRGGSVILDPGEMIRIGKQLLFSENVEITVSGSCTLIIKDSKGVVTAVNDFRNAGESLVVNGIADERYDLFLENREILKSGFADDILVTRTFSDSGNGLKLDKN